MDIEHSLNRLFSLHTFGVKLGLDNIKNFMDALSNPQLSLKTFHIAGSNGKGSTAAFIASILQEMNYKVGLYTSPHFKKFNERIKINNEEISDFDIVEFLDKYNSEIDELKLTFFETTTALAFNYFHQNKIDFGVIETGLGGRLDATNVLNPLAAIITSISLEHTNVLGDTIEKIASEKAGIIKDGIKVFIGLLPVKAVEIIEETCSRKNCELFKLQDYIIEKKHSVELYTEELELDEWIMPLKGKYQKYNAALAALTVSKTLNNDNFRLIENGIKNVVKNTGLQGRYEFFNKKPDIIFDSAHNPEGIHNFINEFKLSKSNYSKTTLLFGAMKDKAVKDMLELLRDSFDEIVLTEFEYERASRISDLKKIAKEINLETSSVENPADYVADFKKKDRANCLVVLGSMYLLGNIKTEIERIETS
jgi:dihydrofolate synthase/folylpolyglutamate synthase